MTTLPGPRGTAAVRAMRQLLDAPVDAIESLMRKMIAETPGVDVDYLVVIDPATFERPLDFHRELLLAGAVRVGKTRLIDNIRVTR